MACLNLLELFKGKKVKVEAEPKRGPGRPKKARFDIEPTMVGIESSEAVGSHPEPVGLQEVPVESANSAVVAVEQQEVAEPLDMSEEAAGSLGVIVELPAAVKLSPREYGLLGAHHGIKGGEFGRLGGRPRKSLSSGLHFEGSGQLVEFEGGSSSNRVQLSHVRKRDESFGIVAKLDICKMVEQQLPLFLNSGRTLSDVHHAVAKETGRTVDVVKKTVKNKDKWVEEQARLRLGRGLKGTLRSKGVSGSFTKTFSVSKGLRAKGAGTKPQLAELYPVMRTWFEKRRAAGYYVDAGALLHQFEYVIRMCKVQLIAKQKKTELTMEEIKKLKICEEKLIVLTKPKSAEYWCERLRFEVGATWLKPQRLLTLSPAEEEHRLLQTWQDFDYRVYNMCFGSLKWLEQHVLEPALFRANIKSTVVSFSDQVPFWVKVKSARQLYASYELSTKGARNDVSRLSQHFRVSQKIEGLGQEEDGLNPGLENNDGMSQLRGQAADNNDKYRITLELQQDLYHYFDIEREPVAKHGKPLLILIGVHARLSNIDDNGCFIKDEHFEFLGKPIKRIAGTSARGLLKSWVALRKSSPEAKAMIDYIDIMQQPAGFSDTIIAVWRIESAAAEYPQSLHVRDLNASYLSDHSRQASMLSHSVMGWIGGKMTAVVQPTDTDVAFPLKTAAGRAQGELRRELQEKAISEGVEPCYKCGPYEILVIAFKACRYVEQQNAETQLLLKCLRRNGFMSFRPDLKKKQLVKVEDILEPLQTWAVDKPIGGHRVKQAWVDQRCNGVKDGIAIEPNWAGSGPGVKKLEDMADVTHHGHLKEKICCAALIRPCRLRNYF